MEVLAQRLLRDEPLELADHVGVAPGLEVCVDRGLGGAQAEVVEAADLRRGERLVGEIGQRFPVPEGERLARAVLAQQALEPDRVHLAAVDLQLIAAPARDDLRAVPVDRPSQVRHVELDHLRRARRGLVAPEPLREMIRGDHASRLQREHREDRPLLAGA